MVVAVGVIGDQMLQPSLKPVNKRQVKYVVAGFSPRLGLEQCGLKARDYMLMISFICFPARYDDRTNRPTSTPRMSSGESGCLGSADSPIPAVDLRSHSFVSLFGS